jgi:hypothetical protein
LPTDLCPWLGIGNDREIRYAEPAETHLCYAQQPPSEIKLDHQAWYCLTGEHRACRFYREPVTPVPPPARIPEEVEDEVGPPPPRFSVLRALLWSVAVVVGVAVIYYYASTLLSPLSTPTPVAASDANRSPTPSVTATLAPAPGEVRPSPAFEFLDPTATPTPYPGGAVYSLSPEANAAGWVASDEARGNHLGDSYLYTGVFDGIIYHGVFQLDLSMVPRGAAIHGAVLEITGLDVRRLGGSGVWEVRILERGADEEWGRLTYQEIHNAGVQWTLSPALGIGDLIVGETNAFELSSEQARDLEQRLLDEHYTVSFRLDGPLAGENSVFAWDTGSGPATLGQPPHLLLNVGAPPKTPIPTGSPPPSSTPTPSLTPTPTNTPVWIVVTNTPTPANILTAAAVAERETVWATTTGTATPTPEFVATATATPPAYIVVTNTPTPVNYATAVYLRSAATANVVLTGTPTPTPPNLVTATYTPRPTRTPVLIWLDQLAGTPMPTPTPMPTTPPMPAILRGKIAFLSDRGEQPGVYVIDPDSGRVALLTARWPYDVALQGENVSPDGQAWAYVQNDGSGVAQVYIFSRYYGGSWQVTYNTGMSYDPVWSPTGDTLAFVSIESGNDDIYTIGIDGQGQKRLTFNQWEWDKHPSWSPDGTQIVFWSNVGSGRRQLWIMRADGTGRRMLLESPYNDWDPVWIK